MPSDLPIFYHSLSSVEEDAAGNAAAAADNHTHNNDGKY